MKLDEEFSVHVIHMNLQHMYFTVMYSSIIIFAVFLSSFSILVLQAFIYDMETFCAYYVCVVAHDALFEGETSSENEVTTKRIVGCVSAW